MSKNIPTYDRLNLFAHQVTIIMNDIHITREKSFFQVCTLNNNNKRRVMISCNVGTNRGAIIITHAAIVVVVLLNLDRHSLY